MKAKEVMSQPVFTCGPGDSLGHAAHLMWENDIGAVPVVDPDGRLFGIVTDRDACMAAYTQGLPLHAIAVSTAMNNSPYFCGPEDSVEDVERIIHDHQVRRVPVVDAQRQVIGIVSLNDLARRAAGKRIKGEHALVETLAAVCKPRRSVPVMSAAA